MSWLTGQQLEKLIEKHADDLTQKAFLGVFSIDTLPSQLPHLPSLLIVNTHTKNLPGEHWKAIYISKDRHGEVFDSLALPVSVRLLQWMNRFTRKWQRSTLTIQNPLSPSCGAFVLYFILRRLQEKDLKRCLNIFSTNLYKNDEIMRNLVKMLGNKK